MVLSPYLVDTVAVDVSAPKAKQIITDANVLTPVSCLSISGKRTAQNFQMANAKGQKAHLLGEDIPVSIIDDKYRDDPMPLQAREIRERLRVIDGRNVIGNRTGAGLSSPRESRSDGRGLAEEFNQKVSDLKHEKYLTAGLEKKYGKTAGKGSLVHPNAHNHGIMMEAVGKDARRPTGSARGAAKPMKGLQADVINLAKMHAEAIERERQDAERSIDMEEALIRRSLHREAAAAKAAKADGSPCFKTVSRDKAMAGNRMLKPASKFGPGHYNICYQASDRHSQTKNMKAHYMSAGRHFLTMPSDLFNGGSTAKEPAEEKGKPAEANGDEAAAKAAGAEGEPDSPGQTPADKQGAAGAEQQDVAAGGLVNSPSGAVAKEGDPRPMTSSFKNTGFESRTVGRSQPKNGGAHLGPTKYNANYYSIIPTPRQISNFPRQLKRPPLLANKSKDPGPGHYDPPRTSYGAPVKPPSRVRRRSDYPNTRAFAQQKGRAEFAEVHDTRPTTAPIVVHTSTALPFSQAATQVPFAPVAALQLMQSRRQSTAPQQQFRGSPPSSPHASIMAANWGSQQLQHPVSQRPGTVPGTFADAGMGMWFDEWGQPLTSAVAVGWGTESSPQGEIAWLKTRYGGPVSDEMVNTEDWVTGGLRSPPKHGSMPRATRTDEVKGQRIMCSSKSGFPLTAPRCNQPDVRESLNPKHHLTERRSPSWSLPKNRTAKEKPWAPPRKLIEAHMGDEAWLL